MYKFETILVALDHTDLDKELIFATAMIAKLAEAKSVKFINVIKDLNVPAAIKKEFPNIIHDAMEERKKEIKREIDRYYTEDKSIVKVEIKSGQPTKSILKFSASKEVDLIIVGRKNEKPGGGVTISRLARRAACSLLIIPKGFKRRISKVLVPVDYSKNSLDALNQTIDLLNIEHFPKPKCLVQHVYQVPSGYHYTGKSFEEFASIMEEHAQKDYQVFMKKVDPTKLILEPIYTLDRHEDIISAIYKTAKKEKAGAIVIGAQGITAAASLFIGGSAEKLVQLHSEIPVLVVRSKEKQKGLIDIIRGI
ncbi:universal stress protein [Reichenbachiella carrageenanivorans]|uniref:Universal stress protein n=1 Tax=Reichenbachiella carrageenanivorans TaxID=2979869 RepID=A0ABY6CXA6_9BACT|nr:universal stress protein [Reichenbachiella carrageenanivorans]UXX78546.1 universal stress protein [Reichenbachiella carrageenanivorans]